MNKDFEQDVIEGLTSTPKFLSSKYFYDEKGSQLFVDIMELPEYYLTRSEYEIFKTQSESIIEAFSFSKETTFNIVELGAGDGTKTKLLLGELIEEGYDFTYVPIDISKHALEDLTSSLKVEIPKLKVNPQAGDYFKILKDLNKDKAPKVILFLGSNIGNQNDEMAKDFLTALAEVMSPGDDILLGVDLIKSKQIVLPAYDDPQNVTRDFNLNLLIRMNRELGADFNINNFGHKATYEEDEGIARSYLFSKLDQTVEIKGLNAKINFTEGEQIHTEISRKYNDQIINDLIEESPLKVRKKFLDSKEYFADYLIEYSEK